MYGKGHKRKNLREKKTKSSTEEKDSSSSSKKSCKMSTTKIDAPPQKVITLSDVST